MTFSLPDLDLNRIPRSPGVYFFVGKRNKVLYVGKAADLRERLRAYFSDGVSDKIRRLRNESTRLKVLPLGSEVEALVKEAHFIRSNRPKYNILLRDDKNYFYVGFTKEKFPKIFITHQPRQIRNSAFLGPYVNGRALKTTLKLLRRAFPYCTCARSHARTCLESQLGLCPGFCCIIRAKTSGKEIEQYRYNIKGVKAVLSGKHSKFAQELDTKLHAYVRRKRFERAAAVRDQLLGLKRVMEHRGLLQSFEVNEPTRPMIALYGLQKLLGMKRFPERIECYDASEISGKFVVGAMTVFVKGEPERSNWRLFRIKRLGAKGDPAHLEEMLTRRFGHNEWGIPDLLLIDGGKPQLGAAKRALKRQSAKIFAASIAKGRTRKNDRLFWLGGKKIRPLSDLPEELYRLLTHIRNETHRFAISFHRRSRSKALDSSFATR